MASGAEDEELTAIQAVVLALTISRARYGYDMANRVERGVCRSFLTASRSAVYSALHRLEGYGYVVIVEPPCPQRRVSQRRWDQRRWYRITPLGLKVYERWITRGLVDEDERVELLSRIMSAGPLGARGLRAVLDRCDVICDVREQVLAAAEADTATPMSIESLCARLVIAERQIAVKGMREWISAARAEIDSFDDRVGAAMRASGAGTAESKRGLLSAR